MVAFMTQSLCLRGPEKVLEIGTGSGYQTVILAALAVSVFTVERIPELAAMAQKALGSLGVANVSFRVGDGGPGLARGGAVRPHPHNGGRSDRPVDPAGAARRQRDHGASRGGLEEVPDDRDSQKEPARSFTSQESIGCRFVPLIGEGGFAS